jgi:hypothetical protein
MVAVSISQSKAVHQKCICHHILKVSRWQWFVENICIRDLQLYIWRNCRQTLQTNERVLVQLVCIPAKHKNVNMSQGIVYFDLEAKIKLEITGKHVFRRKGAYLCMCACSFGSWSLWKCFHTFQFLPHVSHHVIVAKVQEHMLQVIWNMRIDTNSSLDS